MKAFHLCVVRDLGDEVVVSKSPGLSEVAITWIITSGSVKLSKQWYVKWRFREDLGVGLCLFNCFREVAIDLSSTMEMEGTYNICGS